MDRVNLDALTREESDQLLQLCQEAAEAHRDMNDMEGAETIYPALLGFLRSQGWQDQVGRGRAHDARDAGSRRATPPARSAVGSSASAQQHPTAAAATRGRSPLERAGVPVVDVWRRPPWSAMGFERLVGGPGYAGAGQQWARADRDGTRWRPPRPAHQQPRAAARRRCAPA